MLGPRLPHYTSIWLLGAFLIKASLEFWQPRCSTTLAAKYESLDLAFLGCAEVPSTCGHHWLRQFWWEYFFDIAL